MHTALWHVAKIPGERIRFANLNGAAKNIALSRKRINLVEGRGSNEGRDKGW